MKQNLTVSDGSLYIGEHGFSCSSNLTTQPQIQELWWWGDLDDGVSAFWHWLTKTKHEHWFYSLFENCVLTILVCGEVIRVLATKLPKPSWLFIIPNNYTNSRLHYGLNEDKNVKQMKVKEI